MKKKTDRKQTEYFTLENMDGHIYCGANTEKIAKKICFEMSNEGICYKRRVGDRNYKKFAFMW